MKKKYLLLIVIFSSVFGMNAQEPQTIEDEYAAYFTLPREALFLHLNKTTYVAGEEIWFKGYAYDQKKQLTSKATTNINVGIYDAEGNQVKKTLFKAKNGITQGNFAIDSTLTTGTYFIKAETNWMKNFKENDAYVQRIEIITDQKNPKTVTTQAQKIDFQFLPEGGHMVANTLSNIGFKVIDNNGKGVAASGIVYDEFQNQVASFESNTLGMGKFLFQAKENIQYTAEIKLENGTVITEKLPKADLKGVSIVLNNLSQDNVIINFSTNTETIAFNPTKQYKVLIHQNGNLKTINLQFENTEKTISISKKDLFKGINTITVFDNNKNPILERLFFNDYHVKKANINITKLSKTKDSLLLSINELKLQKNANISISVLPEKTKSYNPEHNILSNFYLKPHVKGYVENPQYYFRDIDRKKKYELDILLLTQGWSRYDWKDIFGKKPNILHPFENGITISGRVNKPVSNVKRIFLHTTKHNNSKFIDLDENQNFTVTGLFLEEDEEVRFSYINKKGVFKKPSMYLRFVVTDKEDKILDVHLKETKNITTTADFSIPKNFLSKKAEALDTVVLETKKRRSTYADLFMTDPEVTDVTEETYYNYYNIVQFLQFNGFNATQNGGAVSIAHFSPKRANPVIFFNDTELRTPNLTMLYNFSLTNIERIVIDRHSRVYTNEGRNADGVIKIYTRETPLFKGADDILYLSTKTTKAFTTGKEYYSPNYNSYFNPIFKKYGVISWIPELKLETSQATNFKIYDTEAENITLFIEGISENGDLISEKKTIQVR
ncbi:MG2 domain-containing protein [Kordia sp.]|uniref:MG2 domain-containing protein n=1 Tax=Kordia sp. TaxID=1965332 RepID=UPI003B5A2626